MGWCPRQADEDSRVPLLANDARSGAPRFHQMLANSEGSFMNDWTRREFLEGSAAVVGSVAAAGAVSVGSADSLASFTERQIMRRRELWRLLGDLPWKHRPEPPRLLRKEEHDGYTLERLVLDLNGV